MSRYDQCDESCTTDCGHCKGAGPPSEAPSRVAGSIGRGLVDAAAAYRGQLATLIDVGPWDD